MTQELLRHVQKQSKSLKKSIPPVQPGDRVKVHQRIIEGTADNPKERTQIFEGLVIAVSHGHGVDKTFTVRKIASGVGVERIFPLHSSKIAKIEVVGKNAVRRSKLYFMRDRAGKQARLKEVALLGYEAPAEEEELSEEAIQEAVIAAEKAEKAAAKEAAMEAEASQEESGESSESNEAPTEESAEEAKKEEPKEEKSE